MDWNLFLDHFEVAHLIQLIIVVGVACIWSYKKSEERFKKRSQKMETPIYNIKEQISDQLLNTNKKMSHQTSNSDRLYEIFIGLLKEKNK